MKYRIGEHILDTQTRTLSLQDTCKNIRPKTLTLLLYLANRSEEIISKQTLLDSVWDDVQVDDGVIFQSVREIRQLFNNPQILLNHPRKGYEFTAELLPVTQTAIVPLSQTTIVSETANEATTKSLPLQKITGFLVVLFPLLILATIMAVWEFKKTQQPQEAAVEQRILVLPIQNHIPYGDYSWLYLGGMEQLIARLDGLPPSSLVFSGDYVPRLMSMAGAGREYGTPDIANLFRISGASLIIETQAHGNTADYKLIYRFHQQQSIKQGVVVTDSFEDGFEQLAEKLAVELQQPLNPSDSKPQGEFSDALFAQAMLSYETDWETSISFFQSYLTLHPDSVMAAIYLSKLYIWQEQLDKAQQTIGAAAVINDVSDKQQAEISLILGRIAAKQQQWQEAEQYFQTATVRLKPHQDWLLKANIAEEQGLTYMAQSKVDKAITAFEQALEYFHITQSPIGINTTSLHLAGAYFQQGEIEKGRKSFEFAKGNIENQGIDFLDSMLAEYQQHYAEFLTD